MANRDVTHSDGYCKNCDCPKCQSISNYQAGPYCPTAEEIATATADIRSGWSEADFLHRRWGVTLSEADKVVGWTPPLATSSPSNMALLVSGDDE